MTNIRYAWEAEDAHWRAPPIMITGRQKSLILKAKMLGRLMAGNRLHLYHAAVVIRFLILSCALVHWWQPFHQEESEIWYFNGGDCRKAECRFFWWCATVTSESLDSREFSRIFLKIHFSILSHLIFTFTSRSRSFESFNFHFHFSKRVKGENFSLFISRKWWNHFIFHSFY